jgi:putative endonuclease
MTIEQKSDPRHRAGEIGESAVREFVNALGWMILDHNVRWRDGELDLIAVDGTTLVFAEVKTLVARGADGQTSFSPFESIGPRKQMKVRKLARRWLIDDLRRVSGQSDTRINAFRFDAFAVTLNIDRSIREIEHLEDAF